MQRNAGNIENISPIEAFTRRKPELSRPLLFDAKMYIHIAKVKRDGKLSNRSVPGILVGYSAGIFYRILTSGKDGRRVEVSKDIRFDQEVKSLSEDGSDCFRNFLPAEEEDMTIDMIHIVDTETCHDE